MSHDYDQILLRSLYPARPSKEPDNANGTAVTGKKEMEGYRGSEMQPKNDKYVVRQHSLRLERWKYQSLLEATVPSPTLTAIMSCIGQMH